MSSKRPEAILIFSKSIEPGRVKTRLRPVLTEKECLSLHLAFLKDTIAKSGLAKADSILYLTSTLSLPFKLHIPASIQKGKDLGQRMKNAFNDELMRYEKVIIIGTDSPTFPVNILQRAFDGLETHELVLGPSEDGGYYLIGLKEIIPDVFSSIPWGTSKVLEATLKVVAQRKVLLLPPCFDIDTPSDLHHLQQELQGLDIQILGHTRKWFVEYEASGGAAKMRRGEQTKRR